MAGAPPDVRNRAVYERFADAYAGLALNRPERALLARLRGRWHLVDMLDLGVGAGRTAYTFAAITRSYVGIDYSPRMIELCKELVPQERGTTFRVGDARDLSALGAGSFDLVLFSYNGIDSIEHEGRLRVLAEIRRVVKPGGCFFFSSHSLRSLPFRPRLIRPGLRTPLRSGYASARSLRSALKARASNRSTDLDAAAARGWAMVRDAGHDFKLFLYYVDPDYQLEQLRESGFSVEGVLDTEGEEIDVAAAGQEPWLHYLCRPRA